MTIAPVLLAVALALRGAAPAPADDVRARVRALLMPIDRPISPEAIRAVGPGADAALADIALSRDLAPWRARALEALAALDSPRAEEVHRMAAAPGEPRTVRRAAVRGLASLVPRERAVATLRPYVEHDADPAIRASAAEALASAAPSDGCAVVRTQAARESPDVRARFHAALARCEAR